MTRCFQHISQKQFLAAAFDENRTLEAILMSNESNFVAFMTFPFFFSLYVCSCVPIVFCQGISVDFFFYNPTDVAFNGVPMVTYSDNSHTFIAMIIMA